MNRRVGNLELSKLAQNSKVEDEAVIPKTTVQYTRYLFVAAFSAISDWVVFSTLLFLVTPAVASQAVARIAGGVVSFLLNKNWSFGNLKSQRTLIEARRFLVLYIFSYTLSLSLFYLMVVVNKFSPYWSKLAADFTCLIFNFIAMKLYVFSSTTGVSGRLKKVWADNNTNETK